MDSSECERVKKLSGAERRTFTIAKRAYYLVSGSSKAQVGTVLLLERGLVPISVRNQQSQTMETKTRTCLLRRIIRIQARQAIVNHLLENGVRHCDHLGQHKTAGIEGGSLSSNPSSPFSSLHPKIFRSSFSAASHNTVHSARHSS